MIDLGKPWPFNPTTRNVLVFVAGFAALIVVLHFIDRTASVWGSDLPRDVRQAFDWITRWGKSDWILYPTFIAWLLAWLLSLVTREKLQRALGELAALSGFIFLGVGVPGLISALLKRSIGRGRPETWTETAPLAFQPWNWTAYDWQGFPSGHSTTSFALAMTVAFLWPRAFWVAMILAATVAMSRVIIGEHYPTDIVAGAVLGIAGAYAVRALFVRRGWLFALTDGPVVRRPFIHIPALFRN